MVRMEFPCVVLWRPEALDCRVTSDLAHAGTIMHDSVCMHMCIYIYIYIYICISLSLSLYRAYPSRGLELAPFGGVSDFVPLNRDFLKTFWSDHPFGSPLWGEGEKYVPHAEYYPKNNSRCSYKQTFKRDFRVTLMCIYIYIYTYIYIYIYVYIYT